MSSREEKARKKAAQERIGRYHDAEARKLAARLEEALAAYRREELDVFELDDVTWQYRRARRALDSFCWYGVPLTAASLLDQEEELQDWWAAGARRHRRD